MKKVLGLILLSILSSDVQALPEPGQVVSGQAEFLCPDAESLVISASDKAILSFEKFNIAQNERVQFVQPSETSSVLNRITGGDPSQILGRLSSNGHLFLVNPNGVYFGPDAVVNTGSFLVSTLNIQDSDFLNQRYEFFVEPGCETAMIINEGTIDVSAGFITFCAPVIENRGVVRAQAGKVAFASAEKISLDFAGDGLIKFVLDGNLERAIIENAGEIDALQGHIEMSMRAANHLVKSVVNMDGIETAASIVECNGVIRLVGSSSMSAKEIRLDGQQGAEVIVGRNILADSQVHISGERININTDRIETHGGAITLNGAVNLGAHTTLDTGSGNIIIQDTVNGPYDFILNAGTGNITASASMGTEERLGAVVISNAHDVNLASITAHSITQLAGSGTTALNGTFSTDAGSITFNNAVTLTGPTALDTSTGSADINFRHTLDGTYPLTLTAGAGNICFDGELGGTSCIGTMTLASAANVTSQTITATSLTGRSLSGLFTSNGALTTTGTPGITLNGAAFAFNHNVTTQGAGPLSITNSGPLSFAAGTTISVDGAFTQNGAGTVSIGNTIHTADSIYFNAPLLLLANTSLHSGAGRNITLASTVNGPNDLTLASEGGNIALEGNIGATIPIGTLLIQAANNVTTNAVSATSIQQTGGTGTTHFSGPLSTTAMNGISLSGHTYIFDSTVATTNEGPLSIAHTGSLTCNPGADMHLSGFFSETGGGPVHLGADLSTASHDISWTSPINLVGPVHMNSGTGLGNIRFSNTLDGPYSLTLASGGGEVFLKELAGASAPLGSLTITGSGLFQNAAVVSDGTIAYTAPTYLGGNLTTKDANIAITGNVVLTATPLTLSTGSGGGNITINGTIDGDIADHSLTMLAGEGDLTLAGTIGGQIPLATLSMSGYDIHCANLGSSVPGVSHATTATAQSTLNFTGTNYVAETQSYTAGTGFNFTAGAPTALGSSGTPIVFNTAPITLHPSTGLEINANGGDVTLTTLLGLGQNLTVDAEILNYTRLGNAADLLGVVDLTAARFGRPLPNDVYANTLIVSSNSPILLTADVNQVGAMTYNAPVLIGADSVTISNGGTGADITFNGTLDADIAGMARKLVIDCYGNKATFDGAVGSVAPLSSITINAASDVATNHYFASGSFTQTSGTGTTTIAAGITTTAPEGIQINTTNVTFQGAVSTANGGNLVLNNAGTFTANSVAFNLDGEFQQLGSGAASIIGGSILTNDKPITFVGPLELGSGLILDTIREVGADIRFDSTVDGAQSLCLNAGTGDILFGDIAGGITPLHALFIGSACNVTIGELYARSLTQSAGDGTTTLNGPVTTTGTTGINLTGTTLVINGTLATRNSGPIVLSNTQELTITPNATINSAGAFKQIGVGNVSLAGHITAGRDISFNSPTILSDAATLDTSPHSQNITFKNTLDGAHPLTLNLGDGHLAFSAPIGASTRLGALSIINAGNFTSQAISASSLSQTAGSGLTTLGPLNTNTPAGITLAGKNFTFNSPITTTNNGSVTVTNSGLLTLNVDSSISGSFTQNGSGPVHFGGTIRTSNGDISFSGPIALLRAAEFTSGQGTGDISFSNTINGAHNLSLDSGSGDITFAAPIGTEARLKAISIASARHVNAQTISAASLIQTAGTGTTSLHGNVHTSSPEGIQLNTANITRGGAWTTTGGGPIRIHNSNLFTSTASGNIYADTSFSQTSSGPISLSGDVNTLTGDITFAGPITLAGNTKLDAGAGNIIFSNTVDGTQNLTLNTNTGNICLQSAIGANIPLGALTVSSGKTFLSGSICSDQSILFTAPVNISGSPSLTSSIGTIRFCSTVDGPGDLTLHSGTNDILFDRNIGSNNRLGRLIITNARDVTLPSLSASAFIQQSGTGTITITGPIHTNSSEGINLAGTHFHLRTLTTTGNGPVTIHHSGLLKLEAGSTLLSGPFSETGSGSARLQGTIHALDAQIALTTPAVLTNAVTLNSNSGGDIVISGPIDGSHNLTLQAGSGDILITADLGSTAPLATFTINSARDVGTQAITAGCITQLTGTGASVFYGILTSTKPCGIHLTGTEFTFFKPLVTNTRGPVIINHNGLLTIANSEAMNLGGPFSQLGPGPVDLGGDIITSGGNDIRFTSPVTLINPAQLDTGAGSITFLNHLAGPHNLSLATGTGNITLSAISASGISLKGTNLLVNTRGGDVSYQEISGTNLEHITIDTGAGNAYLNTISGAIHTVKVTAGNIYFTGPIRTLNANFEALGEIKNLEGPVRIKSSHSTRFNALDGDVGTWENPLLVHTPNDILAGSTYLVNINQSKAPTFAARMLAGSAEPFIPQTILDVDSNPACVIIYNGIVIFDCNVTPRPKPPLTIPQVDGSGCNLACDFYFEPFFLGSHYLDKGNLLFYTTQDSSGQPPVIEDSPAWIEPLPAAMEPAEPHPQAPLLPTEDPHKRYDAPPPITESHAQHTIAGPCEAQIAFD